MRTRVFLVAMLLSACKPTAPTTGPTEAERAKAEAEREATAAAEAAAAAERERSPGCLDTGRLWDGHHAGCTYEVAGCCYDTPADACEAAACPVASCQIMEFAPAQIHCRGGGDAPTS